VIYIQHAKCKDFDNVNYFENVSKGTGSLQATFSPLISSFFHCLWLDDVFRFHPCPYNICMVHLIFGIHLLLAFFFVPFITLPAPFFFASLPEPLFASFPTPFLPPGALVPEHKNSKEFVSDYSNPHGNALTHVHVLYS
jgi:hypothetical protein